MSEKHPKKYQITDFDPLKVRQASSTISDFWCWGDGVLGNNPRKNESLPWWKKKHRAIGKRPPTLHQKSNGP